MKDQIRSCKKCQKTYSFLSTGTDLCKDCVEKYPYFISFVEQGAVGVMDRAFGRIEVRSNKDPMAYAIDEIAFLFKDNQRNTSRKRKEFRKFRERWDFKNVSEEELDEVKEMIDKKFNQKYLLED